MSFLSKFKRGTRPSLRAQLRETEVANMELQRKMATAQLESVAFRQRAERSESRLARVVEMLEPGESPENYQTVVLGGNLQERWNDAYRLYIRAVAIAEGRDDGVPK